MLQHNFCYMFATAATVSNSMLAGQQHQKETIQSKINLFPKQTPINMAMLCNVQSQYTFQIEFTCVQKKEERNMSCLQRESSYVKLRFRNILTLSATGKGKFLPPLLSLSLCTKCKVLTGHSPHINSTI